jgi:hypothetical protein
VLASLVIVFYKPQLLNHYHIATEELKFLNSVWFLHEVKKCKLSILKYLPLIKIGWELQNVKWLNERMDVILGS